MAYAQPYSGNKETLSEVHGWFGQLRQRWSDYRSYRHTLSELSELSDAELDDLGLLRADLKSVAFESVYGR